MRIYVCKTQLRTPHSICFVREAKDIKTEKIKLSVEICVNLCEQNKKSAGICANLRATPLKNPCEQTVSRC